MRIRSSLLVVLAGCWLVTGCAAPPPNWHGAPYLPPAPAADFQLEDQSGRTFRLSSNAGNATLLFFGYTHCPDICPTTVANVNWVFDALGDRAGRLTFAFITIDPERDSPQVLDEYLGRFNPTFLGLSENPDALERIRGDFGIVAEVDHSMHADMDYFMVHTGRLYLIDPQGMLQTSYSYGTAPDEILADVRAALGGG